MMPGAAPQMWGVGHGPLPAEERKRRQQAAEAAGATFIYCRMPEGVRWWTEGSWLPDVARRQRAEYERILNGEPA